MINIVNGSSPIIREALYKRSIKLFGHSFSSLTPHPSLYLDRSMERFTLLSLLVLLIPYLCFAEVESTVDPDESDDLLIHQVVSDGEDRILNAEHHFSLFKSKYGKTYATQEEHDFRFSVFKENLRQAKRHQVLDPTAVHGVTQFSDITPEEFRRNFLGLKRRLKLPADAQKAPILPTNNLPTDFDWREKGAVTRVKNQVRKLQWMK